MTDKPSKMLKIIWYGLDAALGKSSKMILVQKMQYQYFCKKARETVRYLNSDEGFAGSKNWRIPTILELATLRDCSKAASGQTTSQTVFVKERKIVEDVEKVNIQTNKVLTTIQ